MLHSTSTEAWLAAMHHQYHHHHDHDGRIVYYSADSSDHLSDVGRRSSSSWGLDDPEDHGSNPANHAVLLLARRTSDAIRWLASNATTSNDEISTSSNSSSSTGGNSTTPGDGDGASASTILRDTFAVYGTVLAAMTLVFCLVRVRFPRPYTIRRWVGEIKTPLADDQHGYLSWIWRLWLIPEDEIRDQCGLDSLCFLRVLRMGLIMSAVGMLNAAWLLPLYCTATDASGAGDSDAATRATVANVPAGSNRLAGTVLAAYILVGFTMRLILNELRWFSRQRHAFLAMLTARNYTVYVRNLPNGCLTSGAVEEYFRHGFPTSVLQARLRVRAPELARLVAKREALVSRLEHAVSWEQKRGRTLTHRTGSILSLSSRRSGGGDSSRRVSTVEHYSSELSALNRSVSERIDAISSGSMRPSSRRHPAIPKDAEMGLDRRGGWFGRRQPLLDSASETNLLQPTPPDSFNSQSADSVRDEERVPLSPSHDDDRAEHGLEDPPNRPAGGGGGGGGALQSLASMAKSRALSAAAAPLQAATSILLGPTEGEPYTAGFVTFTRLSAVHASLQMVQNEEPFAMQVVEAPDPEDVMWSNVGRTHKDLQLGLLLSMSATVAICFLWTIPMAFLASLSSVGALKEGVPFIAELLAAAPFLEPVFQLVAPLLVPIVNSLLPSILGFLSSLEGPVSGAVNGASTFGKLSSFMIIQTFFVSAISGGILQEITNILNNPASVVDLLAKSLPSQSTYFIQIVFVGTVVMVGLELLRVTPIAFAAIRRHVGPRLTEKEKKSSFLCFRPLSDPSEFPHADLLAQVVLYFTVQLVYAVIAPITSFVLAFCFLYMGAAYRHQIVYIYPTHPDSGGKLWTRFIGILISCMIIAEVTVLGLLVLKKSVLAIPLMLPLIFLTGLFSAYIRQEHFRVASYLPLRHCSDVDHDRSSTQDFDALFRDAYLQPELQTRVLHPETGPCHEPLEEDHADELFYFTPNQSEVTDAASHGMAPGSSSDPLGSPPRSPSNLQPFSHSLDKPFSHSLDPPFSDEEQQLSLQEEGDASGGGP